jgi:1,4-dihydroxy-2-naphthoate octaprenyltransferase
VHPEGVPPCICGPELSLNWEAVLLSIPAGILTFSLLLLNEFPDLDADRMGGRRNTVMLLRTRNAALLFSLLTLSVYAFLVAGLALGAIPPLCAIALCTLALALKAAVHSFDDPSDLGPFTQGLTYDVQTILPTQALAEAGLFASLPL